MNMSILQYKLFKLLSGAFTSLRIYFTKVYILCGLHSMHVFKVPREHIECLADFLIETLSGFCEMGGQK